MIRLLSTLHRSKDPKSKHEGKLGKIAKHKLFVSHVFLFPFMWFPNSALVIALIVYFLFFCSYKLPPIQFWHSKEKTIDEGLSSKEFSSAIIRENLKFQLMLKMLNLNTLKHEHCMYSLPAVNSSV
jgi:hypothetical protein